MSMDSSVRSHILSAVPAALIFAVSAVVLFLKRSVLAKAAAISIWSPDACFAHDFLNRPGGILEYCGEYLTQFGHVPFVGISLMLALMAACVLLCGKAFGKSVLAFLPAVCMLLFWTGMDYNLFVMRAQGYVYSQMLGILAASAVAALYSSHSGKPLVFALLTLVAGFPLIGAYALVAALCIAVIQSVAGSDGRRFIVFASIVLAAALVPQIYTRFVFSHIDVSFTYLAGTPLFDFNGNEVRWLPIAASGLFLILLPLVSKASAWLSSHWAFNLIVSVLICLGVVFFSYWDKNFHSEIKMEQALEANDWDRVLEIASGLDSPTRISVMYRNIALLYKGQLLDRMYDFPDECNPINTKAPVSMTMVCAPVSFFYYGMLQYSTRWAMECTMLYQPGVQRYKYMVKNAIFSGIEKPALVEKYLRIIDANMFQHGWVEKYRAMLYDRTLLENDPEYRMSVELNRYEEPKFMSSAVVENTILRLFANLERPQGRLLDLSLASVLEVKKPELFWDKYDQWNEEGRPMTKTLAEAALLFAYMNHDETRLADILDRIGGADSRILKRFNSFSAAANRGSDESFFKKNYGDTYWYHCFFMKELLTD